MARCPPPFLEEKEKEKEREKTWEIMRRRRVKVWERYLRKNRVMANMAYQDYSTKYLPNDIWQLCAMPYLDLPANVGKSYTSTDETTSMVKSHTWFA